MTFIQPREEVAKIVGVLEEGEIVTLPGLFSMPEIGLLGYQQGTASNDARYCSNTV
jgi:hypothetical protein